jgi:hypothetical protein
MLLLLPLLATACHHSAEDSFHLCDCFLGCLQLLCICCILRIISLGSST